MGPESTTSSSSDTKSSMETTPLDHMFSDQWQSAVSSCHDSLEPQDLRHVNFFNSWDSVQKEILKTHDNNFRQASHQEFDIITPGLIQMRTFAEFLSQHLIAEHDISVIWGMIGLIIKIAQDEESARSRVPRMLRDICRKIEILNNYCDNTQSLTLQIKEACLESGLALLSFLSETVKFLRSDVVYSRSKQSLDNEWQPLSQKLSFTLDEFDNLLSRIEKISQFAGRSGTEDDVALTFDTLSLTREIPRLEEQAKLPCIILPAVRTPRFFNRTDVIEKMDHHFSKMSPDTPFRSLALYGLGGVGKSSIALRFAEAKIQRGELDAMFWVCSEKLVTMRQSFTDIAMRLKLPGAQSKDHDENQALVSNWLQQTRCRWLIIYDNVESIDLLRAYWPATTRGQAVITTRNHSFAFDVADGGLEITTWDTETGSRFLLHLLATDISADLANNETTSAQELSHKLNGHALALCHMAGLIHRRRWSIAEFMEIYSQHPSEMHGVSGNNSINALWDFAFKSLDPQSRKVLGVLSFVSPDSIPESLFEPVNAASLPESLNFCSDHLRFSEVIENLLTLALIKRNGGSRTLSLHRLVQMSFKYSMTAEERQQNFNDASILVSSVFPQRGSNLAQLYLVWDQCGLWLQHVLSLKDRFREERKSNPMFAALSTYCDLNNRCQRQVYLLEINAYTELEDLVQTNTEALSTLPKKDQTTSLQGSLTSHTGQLLVRLGKPAEGVDWLKKSYEIRSHDVPFNPRESAWAAENAANGIASLNAFDEAIQWQERARDHWLDWSNEQTVLRGTYPAALKRSMARILAWAGQFEQARTICDEAIQQINCTEPYNWAMAAYTYFALATVDRFEHKFESAETHFMQAQNLWIKGDQLRTDPFNAACMYKMGCTALDQGKLEAAVKHLRDAMRLTSMHKTTLTIEHARCVFKLSEALKQEPRNEEEAKQLREEAEVLLRQRDFGAKEPKFESTYDALVNIRWR